MKFDLTVVRIRDEHEILLADLDHVEFLALSKRSLWRYDLSVEPRRPGNWTPDGKAERAALRRAYRELTPAQRVEQVIELSRFMSKVAEAGHRHRLA
jgi:hypothetical protein